MPHGSLNKFSVKGMMSRPLAIVIVVAIVGVLGMLLVDHGPWTHPQVKNAKFANYKTTLEAAQAVGATVTQTKPKRTLEPVAPGPKPAEPSAPVTQ